jgi:hypothetical protein
VLRHVKLMLRSVRRGTPKVDALGRAFGSRRKQSYSAAASVLDSYWQSLGPACGKSPTKTNTDADTEAVITAKYLGRDEAYSTWGVPSPAYQVDFWTHLSDRSADMPAEKVGHKQDAYLLTGAADIREVMAWAEENANGRIVVVYAVIPDQARGRGLVHLSGTDPTRDR